jgi:hypothetical protein
MVNLAIEQQGTTNTVLHLWHKIGSVVTSVGGGWGGGVGRGGTNMDWFNSIDATYGS